MIVEALKRLGYEHVSLDLEGYQTGKMNRELSRWLIRNLSTERQIEFFCCKKHLLLIRYMF